MEAVVPLKHWNEHITLYSVKKLARLLFKLEFYYVLITLTHCFG
jgi:hypothetical protein